MHYLTLVIGEEPDEQLAPAGSETEKFIDREDEYREEYLTEHFYGRPIRELFPTFEDYMAECFGPPDERTGRYGEWVFAKNPNYDWYVHGGRFTGHLILKPGRRGYIADPKRLPAGGDSECADHARKGDIDFEAMSRVCYENFVSWWNKLEQAGKTADTWEKRWNEIPESVKTREQLVRYARSRSVHNAPDAVVINGEWFGPWWIKNDLTEAEAERWDRWFSAQLAQLPDDTLLTVIDCHNC